MAGRSGANTSRVTQAQGRQGPEAAAEGDDASEYEYYDEEDEDGGEDEEGFMKENLDT